METSDLRITISNTLDYRVTNDAETLSLVAAIIMANNPDFADFQPTEVIIATLFLNAGNEVCIGNVKHCFSSFI